MVKKNYDEQLDPFPVHVGLQQGWHLKPVLFRTSMDRISRHSKGLGGSGLGTRRFHICFSKMTWFCWIPPVYSRPTVCTGAVCSRAWSGQDESQLLQVRDHGKAGLSPSGWEESNLKWRSSNTSGGLALLNDSLKVWKVTLCDLNLLISFDNVYRT